MKCKQFIADEVYTCAPNTAVGEVAQEMRERGIGFVPVADERGRITATVTDRDLCIHVLGMGRGPDVEVGDVMHQGAICCHVEDDLREAEQKMAENQVQRIVIVDDDQRAVGVISQADLARAESDAQRTQTVFKAVHSPTPPNSPPL
jgi:CBS domain-containing protein